MAKAMEKYPKRGRSACRFTGNGLDADSRTRRTSSVKREKHRVEVHAENKEGTTMTKEKRLGFLTMLQQVMSHPYGVVFNDIENISGGRAESFKGLEKPIDLETVNSMLEKNLYATVEDFAADVRTTFSNALQIFPTTDDVHKMATKLSEYFEIGFKITVESMNRELKTCNDEEVSEKKETQGKKTNSSSRKRKSAAASSGREKIYVVRQESDRKRNPVSVTGTHLVSTREGKSFDITVVSGAPEKSPETLESPVAMSPRRAARIAKLMERFSSTIKKAEMVLSASAPTNRDEKKEAQLKVKEQRKREREARLKVKEQRKREREALERMENTAKFGADHEALREFEWLLGHSEFRMTDESTSLPESMSLPMVEDGAEEVGGEEMEEGEIPLSPRASETLHYLRLDL